jgi:hypothetical protein
MEWTIRMLACVEQDRPLKSEVAAVEVSKSTEVCAPETPDLSDNSRCHTASTPSVAHISPTGSLSTATSALAPVKA